MKRRLIQHVRDELYDTNKVFVENHEACREELFERFHELRGESKEPEVSVWLEAVSDIERYFVFSESERNMFYIIAENFYNEIEGEFEEYPLENSPQFHFQCESFVCWFDTYLNRFESIGKS